MASYGGQMHHQAAYGGGGGGPPMAAPGVAAPAGTFSPGTKIQVGGHRVVIQKYLSEGGFAHVYLVKLPKPIDGTDQAVLKRVAVPDKESLRGMRTEVETMKRLKGHKPIVTYFDSHASEMRGGGYEVFLLMEYCNGGGLIDFMNTRLQHRLTEPEIINIFSDIAEGVACMHYLKPALLHRDLKVENVLITSRGSVKRFKLCDFGSASPPKPAPTTVVECRLMDEDVQKHTTLQYRSPEMIDVYRKQPMNEKADIWALGVLLYKLCYYTTPFEDQGQLAILNASYKFPSYPPFSNRLQRLISSMLKENLNSRPNIYQVLKEACSMQGREVPIHDIYSGRSQADSRSAKEKSLPQEARSEPKTAVGAVWSPPVEQKQSIPDVVPMRRGRVAPSPQPALQSQHAKPSKVTGGDPFAALDSKSAAKTGEMDEFSSRFPSLDQFSLLHDQGSKFDFDSSPTSPQVKRQSDLSQRVTERLADEAFASSRPTPPPTSSTPAPKPQSLTPVTSAQSGQAHYRPETGNKPLSVPSRPEISRAQSIISNNPELQAISSQNTPRYVSTGTMTSDSPIGEQVTKSFERASHIHASENPPRSSSLPTQPVGPSDRSPPPEPRASVTDRVSSLHALTANERSSTSTPSLEAGRPQADLIDVVPRNNLSVHRSRPSSNNFENTTLDYLREREASSRPQSRPAPSPQAPSPKMNTGEDDRRSSNDLEFLRSMESSELRNSDKAWGKRSSMSSLSGGKNKLAGKFGDAFKRFEGSTSPARTPSPLKEQDRRDLTPIAGSEATDGRTDDGHDDEDQMSPEMRREMERLKLEEEERRVEAAQAEHRKRTAVAPSGTGSSGLPKSIGGVPRAVSIQNRVQSLLDEQKDSGVNVQRTAEGYGKYSDAATAASKPADQPETRRKPVAPAKPQAMVSTPTPGREGKPPLPPKPTGMKPPAPKKPGHLNSVSPTKQQSADEQLIAFDLPGQPVLDMSAEGKDNYIRDFTQRYPSLSALGIEQDAGQGSGQ